MAHAYIDAIADAGADAIKFQTHIAAAESTLAEPWRVKFSEQDTTRFAYWKRMEFTEEQWCGLKRHTEERGLKFLSSAFSIEAVELLTRVGVAAWKIASGEVSNVQMLDRILSTHLPVIVSTGMSSLDEIDATVARVKAKAVPLTLLQCTSLYPCPPDKIGLNLIPFFRKRFGCHVGLSDHSGKIYSGLAAATLGVELLEVHVTLSREMFGPDVPVSLTTTELRQLVEGVRFIESIVAHPLRKDHLIPEAKALRDLFTKSVVARVDLPAGTVLRSEHLSMRKPGTGIPAARISECLGRRLRSAVEMNHLLKESDLL